MIKPVMLIRTAVTIVLPVVSGCMVSPGSPVLRLAASRAATQPATIAAVIDPARFEQVLVSTTRPDTTPAAGDPSSQPAKLADLADRAGGPAGGFIVGAVGSAIEADAVDRAKRANDEAEQHPAQVSDVLAHATADLNGDGFITLDEITAMNRAGLSESLLLQRLRDSKAIFSATTLQQQYLRDRGVPESVIHLVAGPNPTTRKSS